MRGVAYSYLAMLWGNVIINEDTDELVANPIVNTSPVSDVYEFAMRDLEFAAKYLPEVSSAAGRVNKYSAFGMLSRVYLTYPVIVVTLIVRPVIRTIWIWQRKRL